MRQRIFGRVLFTAFCGILLLPAAPQAIAKTQTAGAVTPAGTVKQTGASARNFRTNFKKRTATGSSAAVPVSTEQTIFPDATGPIAWSPSSNHEIQAVLNGLDAITEKVIPAVIQDNGLDHVEYAATLVEGKLEAQNWITGNWKECATFKVSLAIEADFPVGERDVTADFEADRVIDTDWDVSGAALDGDVEVELGWGADANNAYCLGWNLLTTLENVIGRTHVSFGTDGLSGELKVAMGDAADSVIGISSVKNATLSFDEVRVTDSAAINKLIDFGISIADLFGVSCSDLEDCVNDRIDGELNKKTILNRIKTGLNDAIKRSATLEGGIDGEFDIEYDVVLASLSTNASNQFSTGWDVDLDSDETDPCAGDLRETSYGSASAKTLGGDVDLTAGFPLISKAAYAIGKQGAFCLPFSGSVDLGKAAEGVSTGYDEVDGVIDQVTDALGTVSYSGTIVPDGAIVVSGAPDENRITLTLPIRLDGFTVRTSLGAGAPDLDEPVSGNLKVAAEIDVSCENGLYLKPVSVALTDLAGSVTVADRTFSVSDMEDDLQEAAEGLLDDFRAITLVPKINSLDALGLGIEIADVDVDSKAVHVAINLTDDLTECGDDDSGDSSDGGTGKIMPGLIPTDNDGKPGIGQFSAGSIQMRKM